MNPKTAKQSVALLKVEECLEDGSLLARPQAGRGRPKKDPVRILLPKDDLWRRAMPEPGARFLARMRQVEKNRQEKQNSYQVSIIRRFRPARAEKEPSLFAAVLIREEGEVKLARPNKNERRAWSIKGNANGAKIGDLVLARRDGYQARIEKRLAHANAPGKWGAIAIQEHGLPETFPQTALAELKNTDKNPHLAEREDLTDLNFITIDPSDARDHDDAVYARPDDSPDNQDGWRIIIAIADVAHYVRPETALDKEAKRRASSAYLADRTVPMLPDLLSQNLCSLKEGQERPSICASLILTKQGEIIADRCFRAKIKVRRNWNYLDFQKARQSEEHRDLWGAHQALERERNKRQPLEISLPEQKVVFGENGAFHIAPQKILESHRLIENFMIAANRAIAQKLQNAKIEAIYRAHDDPAQDKKDLFKTFLSSFVRNAPSHIKNAADFNKILERAKDSHQREILSLALLRAQAQAHYSRKRAKHFGLQCEPYLHFTSPIRRYADLIAHRALIALLKLGEEDGKIYPPDFLDETAQHLSEKERQHQLAEYDTLDRYAAAALQTKIGKIFSAWIVGATRAGLFLRVKHGAEGLLPLSQLGDERFRFNPKTQTLQGQRSGKIYRAGETLRAKLEEASPITGRLRFALAAK